MQNAYGLFQSRILKHKNTVCSWISFGHCPALISCAGTGSSLGDFLFSSTAAKALTLHLQCQNEDFYYCPWNSIHRIFSMHNLAGCHGKHQWKNIKCGNSPQPWKMQNTWEIDKCCWGCHFTKRSTGLGPCTFRRAQGHGDFEYIIVVILLWIFIGFMKNLFENVWIWNCSPCVFFNNRWPSLCPSLK